MDEVFRGLWVIAYRDLIRFRQEKVRLLSSFAMPLLFIAIAGAGFTKIIGDIVPGVSFTRFLYPGVLAMTVFMNSFVSGLSIVWDREFGFLKKVLVAPMSRTGIVLGKAAGNAVIALGQGILLLLLAPVAGVDLDLVIVLKLIPLLFVLSLSLSSLGILIASRMRSQQGFQVLVMVVMMPMIFLSGVFFPVNDISPWLEVVSKLNPLTYGVDAIRQIFLNSGIAAAGGDTTGAADTIGVTVFGHTMSVVEDTLVVVVIGAALLALAIWAFGRQE